MRPRKCTRLNCRYLEQLCTVQLPYTYAAFTSDEQQRFEGKRRGGLNAYLLSMPQLANMRPSKRTSSDNTALRWPCHPPNITANSKVTIFHRRQDSSLLQESSILGSDGRKRRSVMERPWPWETRRRSQGAVVNGMVFALLKEHN